MSGSQQNSTIAFRTADMQQFQRQTARDPLVRFVFFADTHISADPLYTYAEADYTPLHGAYEIVRQINALPFTPDFVIHGGDVVYDPDDNAYVKAREILSDIRYPVHYLLGNHDERSGFQRILLGMDTVTPKHYYTFEQNGVQFVMLDSNAPAPFARGTIGSHQLDWLRGQCNPADPRPLVVCVHHNVLPIGSPFWDEFMRVTDGEALHDILRGVSHRLRGVFTGHVHQGTDIIRDGVTYVSAPSTWYQLHCWPGQAGIEQDLGSEPGFIVVTITAEQTFMRRHRYHVPEHGQNPMPRP